MVNHFRLIRVGCTSLSKEQVVRRPDGARCSFTHCAEGIDEVKYSPDGALLAAGSHDNFIDVYDVKGDAVPGRSTGVAYHRLYRLKGRAPQ